jgi:hypothetical protein
MSYSSKFLEKLASSDLYIIIIKTAEDSSQNINMNHAAELSVGKQNTE